MAGSEEPDIGAQGAPGRTPRELLGTLGALISHDLNLSLMIWGPPGVGKSSIVAQCASAANLDLIDLRLSQLAPTDLRGLPVPKDGVSTWYPPDFLPRAGQGVLFLDEINMAPPAMQGIAQQLILDRRIGSYRVPEGWFVWAAGNRKEDRASVFDMPAPLANRFLHLSVEADFDSFRSHALDIGIDERVIAFLSFRPELLFRIDDQVPAWPSPRTWVMASRLIRAGLPIGAAVGGAVALEFEAYEAVYSRIPNLDAIMGGKGGGSFPSEPSARYAVTVGLIVRSTEPERARVAIEWAEERAPPEWFQLLAGDILRRARERGQAEELTKTLMASPALRERLAGIRDVLFG